MSLHKYLSTGSIYLNVDGMEEKYVHSSTRRTRFGKYAPAMKHCLPYRPPPKNSNIMPGSYAGLFSYVSLSWLTKVMFKAYKRGLNHDDTYELQLEDSSEHNANRFEHLLEKHSIECKKENKNISLARVVWSFCKTRLIVAIVLMMLATVFQFMGPAFIQQYILLFVEDKSQPLWWGLVLVFLLFWCTLLRNYCFGAGYTLSLFTAIRLQGAVQCLVYKKMLKLRSEGDRTLGQVLTFCTNEMERVFESIHLSSIIFGTPVMFTLCVIYSLMVIGPWSLTGCATILLFYPLMSLVARLTGIVRIETVKVTDSRVGLMSEILNSIRLIKMYAWEDSFAKKIAGVRDSERRQLIRAAFLQSFSTTITPTITLLASILTFLGYSISGNNLLAAQAFTIFSVFTAMQFSVGTLPYGIRCLVEAGISCNKLQNFISRSNYAASNAKCSSNRVIEIDHASFAWEAAPPDLNEMKKKSSKKQNGIANGSVVDEKDKFLQPEENVPIECLFNIHLEIPRGKLIGICGSVGAGKSSLISAIMGDMIKLNGEIRVDGTLAIVPQQAWIYNGTVRENILFGQPMDEARYQKTLDCCSLRRDLELLSEGDLTEIGARGSNLSGGQKQRMSLARAVYSNKEIILLDDPLSAVDAKVAKSIFRECIKGFLKEKTILLVTHGIQFLEQCDQIAYIKDGSVTEWGTHIELASKEGDYAQLLQFDQSREQKSNDEESETVFPGTEEEMPIDDLIAKFGTDEQHDMSVMGWRAYIKYAKFCGGYIVMILLMFLIILFTFARISGGIWLQVWLDMGDGLEYERRNNASLNISIMTEESIKGYVNDNPNVGLYQIVYIGTFVSMIVIGLIKGYSIARQLLIGSSTIHDTMFRKVMLCPLSFFDVTPVGRILQRFSRDMDEADVRVPFFFEFVGQGISYVTMQMLVVCVIFPIYTVGFLIALTLFILLDTLLNVGLREARKLDNINKSPVLSHISSSFAGLSVIRTFNKQRVFLDRFCAFLDRSLSSELMFRGTVRWITFRMDMIATVMVTLTGLIVVLLRDSVTAAQCGLALSSVFGVCTFVPYVMQLKSEMQARFTSVERIIEYTQDIPEEAPRVVPDNTPDSTWPKNGEVKMENVQLRYRPELPPVLVDVTADIQGGEKLGVVGRTGAGKSSLIASLLRLTELSGGRILIDGVDVSKIGLHTLRNVIAIIPQDPVLFQGTMRYNLDPFDEHSDERIWEVLEKAHLKEKIAKEEKQLLGPVESDGGNFSVGEKQLICLARALLRNTKILLLDEATASVDVETDFLIQRTLREAFASCTTLTIAHRLNTVASCDRILVMDAGKVVEFDTPANLMSQENSLFRQMMLAAGITSLDLIQT